MGAPPRPGVADIDSVNRGTWNLPATIRACERLQDWSDPGEQAAIEYVAQEVNWRPILDIGVGAGRTTTILRTISRKYIGIDYTREMVDVCRARHPGARIVQMDARDLRDLQRDQFALVMFSMYGIDSVGYADRLKVLAEVNRVLQPNGLFVFSALNRDGPACGQTPGLHFEFSWNSIRHAWRTLLRPRQLLRSVSNYRGNRALIESHDDWAIMNCADHDFGLVAMYTTLAEQKRQLDAAGFDTELVLDNVKGQPVADGADTRAARWLHYVARKR